MQVYIGADHAGFNLKKRLLHELGELGMEVFDEGASELNEEDDYPDFIQPVARAVSDNPKTVRGIIIGGSGQGEAMAANRFSGVRAAVYYGGPNEIVTLSREHNDANVLSLGARFMSEDEGFNVVKLWLKTNFSGDERHKRRIIKIDSY
jgi:ribose 5-phosphate isomerase B